MSVIFLLVYITCLHSVIVSASNAMTISGERGLLLTLNHPGLYEASKESSITITVPDGYVVMVRFDSFDVSILHTILVPD